MRLDNYLASILNHISRSRIKKALETGEILVDGEIKKPSYEYKEGDEIEINLTSDEAKIKPENIELDVRFEDEYMLVVNKPKGMLTHPTSIETSNTLVNALLYRCGKNLSDVNGIYRPGILHRLDRNTSGLLMVAKTNDAHVNLSTQVAKKTAIRKYLAIVKGVLTSDGIINAPIGRHKTQKHKMAVIKDGKPALTKYNVIENFNDFTFMEFELFTGRTHQIRVHSSYIGHPIYGDSLYGGGGMKVKTIEQVLQSYYLKFMHPYSDKIIEIELDPDEDLLHVLKWLRSRK